MRATGREGGQVKGRDGEKSIGMERRGEGTPKGPRTVGSGALFNKSRLMRVIDHRGKGGGQGLEKGWSGARWKRAQSAYKA